MKRHLKLLVYSVLVALTFASPRAVQGMEPEPAEKFLFQRGTIKIPTETPRAVQGMEPEPAEKFLFQRGTIKIPTEIVTLIVKFAAIDNYLSNGRIAPLQLVCQEWHGIINKDFVNDVLRSACELSGYGEIYQRFLNGVLVYRPQEGSDVGMIKLPIAALGNPLEGTFDLSQCGDAGQYLSISTGYRKQKKAENANKLEIWFAPRSLIEKEIKTTATHFRRIYDNWNNNAPVGIFWTWGGWDRLVDYDDLTTETMDNLSKINLYENWQKSTHKFFPADRGAGYGRLQKFLCSFCELK